MFTVTLFTIPRLGAIRIYFLQERKQMQRTDTAYPRPQSPLAEQAGRGPRPAGIRVDLPSPLLRCLSPWPGLESQSGVWAATWNDVLYPPQPDSSGAGRPCFSCSIVERLGHRILCGHTWLFLPLPGCWVSSEPDLW